MAELPWRLISMPQRRSRSCRPSWSAARGAHTVDCIPGFLLTAALRTACLTVASALLPCLSLCCCRLFPRQQKILCKGKVVSGLPSSTTLLQAGIASGSKLMLLAAQGGSTQPSQGQAALKTTQDARRQEMRRRLDEAAAQNPNASAAPPVNAMQARLATWRKTGIAALRDLKLAAVPPEAFSAAGAIRVLDLGGNQLTVLPPSISQLTSLQKLRLSINNMSDAGMPWEELASLQSLAVLALDSNKLTLLPPCLSQLTRLQKLTAEHNQIAQLPAAVGALTSLRALTLRGNRLTALPPALAECVALEEVDASSNPLQALPTELGRLTNLKVLLLDNTL